MWGEPAALKDYMGKQYWVRGTGGPQGYQWFPVTMPRQDGLITYLMQIQFKPGYLQMTNHCIYRNPMNTIVATLSAEAEGAGDQNENGYVIHDPKESKTERDGRKCGIQIGSAKYTLRKDQNSLRIYVDSESYMELVWLDTTPLAIADEELCPLDRLREGLKKERRRLALSAKAQAQARCTYPHRKTPTLEGLVQTKILNSWVLHSREDDVRAMAALAQRNQASLADAVSMRPHKGMRTWGPLQEADLTAVLTAFGHACNLVFELGEKYPRIFVSGIQEFEDTDEESCLGLAVILAAQGISVTRKEEVFVLSFPTPPSDPSPRR